MMKRSKGKLGISVLTAVLALAASAASSVTKTIAVPVIDTNVPLYVLVDVPKVDTTPLGMTIIMR